MQWSYQIGTVFGIPLRLHITFPMLIIAYAALFGYQYGLTAALRGALLIFLLFIFVICHELAHSKQAQKYGVNVRNVTLLPIGGVSSMESIPEDPNQELRIALAGPGISELCIQSSAQSVIGLTGRKCRFDFGTWFHELP